MPKTILVAEDEGPLANAIRTKLSSEDFEVIIVSNGLDVLENAGKADIILLDIIMPSMDGLEALHRLQEKGITKKAKVIMLTNLDRESDKETALQNEAIDYVVKSEIDLEELVKVIKKYLEDEPDKTTEPAN